MITKRLTKGSPLTYEELDANFEQMAASDLSNLLPLSVTTVNSLKNQLGVSSSGIGVGGTGTIYNTHSTSRATGVIYTNSYIYPIAIAAALHMDGGGSALYIFPRVNGVMVTASTQMVYGSSITANTFFIVQAGQQYQIDSNGSISMWNELY